MNGLPDCVVLEGVDRTDAQWAVLEPMFRPRRRPDGRGRPWTDSRRVLDAVLWILRTGVRGPICRGAIAISDLSPSLPTVATLGSP